jgi:hypothetical protein
MEKRTKDEWQRIIEEFKKSGQTQAQWCKSRDISIYTFRNEKKKLERTLERKETRNSSSEDTSGIQWLSITQGTGKKVTGVKICVKHGSFIIAVEPEFNENTLIQICKILKTI